jgi:hypothetical protein
MSTNKKVIFRLFVPVLALLTTIGTSSTVVGQTYPEGMIAYWKFDEGSGTIAYSSVGQHTGTVSGPDWTAGQVGGALYFEGTPIPRTPAYNDYVVVPHHADLNVPGNEISIEAWVNFTGEVGAWDHQIVSKTAPYPWFGYTFGLFNGLLSIAIFNGQYPTGSCCLSANFQMPYGWHHVVGMYSDVQDLARLYMDGVLVAENTSFITVLNNSGNTSDLFIGKLGLPNYDEWHLWKGTIDEVAIYNRILLPEEVAEHYQNGLNGLGYEIRIIPVVVDIKPGSDPNSINPKSKGVIPVAVLTTDDFDATSVDPLSVEFGPNGAKETHGKGHIEDVDGDGDMDMVLHFKTQDSGIQCGQTAVTLTGETIGGIAITGTDAIQTVGCGANKAVADAEAGIPESYALLQNHPNPFNPETELDFQLPEANHVVVKIFNTLGEEIRTLVEAPYEAGYHRVRWDGKDKNGNPVASGIYLYQLQAGDFSQVRKMALLR